MNRYKVSITFTGADHPVIIWELEAFCIELLVPDVAEKLCQWMGANGLYLRKASEVSFELRLATLSLGWVEIEKI